MQPSDILLEAAQVINEYCWTQGQYRDADEGFCVVGALRRSYSRLSRTNIPDLYYTTYVRAARILMEVIGACPLEKWNDLPGRTKDEVVGALVIAADRPEAHNAV